MFSKLKALALVLILWGFSGSARANDCLSKLFRLLGMPSLSADTRALLPGVAANFKYSGLSYLKNVSSEEFFYIFDKLPKEAQAVYLDMPDGNRAALRYLQHVQRAYGNELTGILADLHQHLQNEAYGATETSQKPSFASKFREAHQAFKSLTPKQLKAAEASLKEKLYREQTVQNFRDNYYLKIAVDGPVLRIGNSEYHDFKVFSDGRVQIKVPRYRVSIASDNGLEPKKIQAILANPFARVPKVYTANASIAGGFYIVDGNHRFALLDKKPEVWVELGSMRTMNLRETILRRGGGEPSLETLAQIYEGKITPLAILPKDDQASLMPLWESGQIVHEPALPIVP